jgi:hypothetical protein
MSYFDKTPLYRRLRDTFDKKSATVKNPNSRAAMNWAIKQLDSLVAEAEGTEKCPECDAGTKKHKHGLSGNLIEGLDRLYRHAGLKFANLRVLDMERVQWDNFQKLKYWGLVEQLKVKSGEWRVTPKGEAFLRGRLKVPSSVITYRGIFVEYEGDDIGPEDAVEEWKHRPEYAEDAVPV